MDLETSQFLWKESNNNNSNSNNKNKNKKNKKKMVNKLIPNAGSGYWDM